MDNESDLVRFVKDAVEEQWKTLKTPYFLSSIEPALKSKNIDYKSILSGERLKSFVTRTKGTDSYTVVEHPIQKAKIALVPPGEFFSFDTAPATEQALRARRSLRSETVLLEFLRALSKLPEEDIQGVVLPVSVLIKLVHK